MLEVPPRLLTTKTTLMPVKMMSYYIIDNYKHVYSLVQFPSDFFITGIEATLTHVQQATTGPETRLVLTGTVIISGLPG